MISKWILSSLHPRVIEIVNNCNIDVLTFQEGFKESIERGDDDSAQSISNSIFSSRAMYNVNLDKILIHEGYLKSPFIDSLVLHELIHSVGIPNKLNRVSLRYYFDLMRYKDTEEYTAQLGAYLLAKTLDLPNLDEHMKFFTEYVSGYPQASIGQAISYANQAIDYIMSRKEVKKAA